MRTPPLFLVLLASAISLSAQPTARQLTRKVVPPPQAPQPAPRPPAPAAPGAQSVPPAKPATPQEIEAQRAKTEKNVLDFQKRRAMEGSKNAQYELGLRYLTGNGVEKNEATAREWLEKSAKAGHEPAIKKLKELGAKTAESSK